MENKSSHKLKNGKLTLQLLPWITIAGLGASYLLYSFGGEIVNKINTENLRDEYAIDYDQVDTMDKPMWKIIRDCLKDNKSDNENVSEQVVEVQNVDVENISEPKEDILDKPMWEIIRDYFKEKNQKEEVIVEVPEEVEEIVEVIEEPTIEEPVEEVVEELEEEVIPEPVIYPEYTSSELLDSGYEFLDIDFEGLKEKNPDVVGWIDIPGTKINYLVVQGEDNEYYLHHDINGNNSANGTIFIDSRVDLSLGDDSSSVQCSPISFYGHSMNSGEMFQHIKKYKKDGYIDEHPFGVYYTPDGVYKLEFFADQYTKRDSDEGVFVYNLDDPEAYEEYVKKVIEGSSFTTEVNPVYGEKIGFLQTCTYEEENLVYLLWYRAVKQYTNELDLPDNQYNQNNDDVIVKTLN